jgi:hypothetical protein
MQMLVSPSGAWSTIFRGGSTECVLLVLLTSSGYFDHEVAKLRAGRRQPCSGNRASKEQQKIRLVVLACTSSIPDDVILAVDTSEWEVGEGEFSYWTRHRRSMPVAAS